MIRLRSLLRSLARRGLEQLCPPDPRYTPITLDYIRSTLPTSPTIVEAGAHDGGNTLQLAAIPGSTIHCFEPVPAVFQKLAAATSALANVHRYPCALGDAAGTARMHVSSGRNDASSSILKPKEIRSVNPDIHFDATISVDVSTLDNWAAQVGLRKVDFLWLDMQGYELNAMKGGSRLLTSVSVIYTEVNLIEVYEGAPLYHDVWTWLSEKGFCVQKVDLVYPDQGEVLFVRK